MPKHFSAKWYIVTLIFYSLLTQFKLHPRQSDNNNITLLLYHPITLSSPLCVGSHETCYRRLRGHSHLRRSLYSKYRFRHRIDYFSGDGHYIETITSIIRTSEFKQSLYID